MLALWLTGCALLEDPGAGPGVPEVTIDQARGEPRVLVRERALVLEDGDDRRLLTTLDPERDGELEHVAVRPGGAEATTVLALLRTGDHFELRYLVADDRGVSDLYWFPWRLQVDDTLVEHHDVAPRPVWSPDGGTVAWLEWNADGTRLRTVGWIDDGEANNPSDDTSAYRLAEVPAGTQLERWEDEADAATLVGSDGEVDWRIELRPPGRAIALPDEGEGVGQP